MLERGYKVFKERMSAKSPNPFDQLKTGFETGLPSLIARYPDVI